METGFPEQKTQRSRRAARRDSEVEKPQPLRSLRLIIPRPQRPVSPCLCGKKPFPIRFDENSDHRRSHPRALDPVRYLTNRSSGKMGYALAEAATRAGHHVLLVSGPTALDVPEGVDFIPVETAAEMYDAVASHLPPRCRHLRRRRSRLHPRRSALTRKIKKSGDSLTLSWFAPVTFSAPPAMGSRIHRPPRRVRRRDRRTSKPTPVSSWRKRAAIWSSPMMSRAATSASIPTRTKCCSFCPTAPRISRKLPSTIWPSGSLTCWVSRGGSR